MQLKPHRAAVIGCGGISQLHIAALNELGVTIAAVCDIRPDRLQAAADKTGAAPYADWHEAIRREDVDTVHICLPHYLHAPVAIEALGLGKNVITEKPMAIALSDARAMIAASEKDGAGTLGVIFQNRYNRVVQRVKALIESGEMGAFKGASASVCWVRELPYYLESGWRGTLEKEGAGSLINQSIHTLDLLGYLGGPIASVRGAVFTGIHEGRIEVEDNAMAVVKYAAGQRAVIHTTNNNVIDAPVEIDIYLERGALKLYGPRLYRITDEALELIDDGDNKKAIGKSYWGTGHPAELEDYYHCLDEGCPFWLDGREGFPALALVQAIIRSSAEGRWVDLETP